MDQLETRILLALGEEIRSLLLDGRRCVIAHTDVWEYWVYEGDGLMYDGHGQAESFEELVVLGKARGVDLLGIK